MKWKFSAIALMIAVNGYGQITSPVAKGATTAIYNGPLQVKLDTTVDLGIEYRKITDTTPKTYRFEECTTGYAKVKIGASFGYVSCRQCIHYHFIETPVSFGKLTSSTIFDYATHTLINEEISVYCFINNRDVIEFTPKQTGK